MYKQLLKNKMILLYLAGAGISQLGNVISGLAFLFLAYELTHSAAYTTVIAVTQAVPYLLFGLIGGAIADRMDKKRLLIWLDISRVPIIFSLVILYQLDLLAFWHIILVSFLIQSIGCFYNPTYRAVLPMITSLEERTLANSLLDTVTRGVLVLGPIVSIGLLNSGKLIHFFTFDAMTYLVSALLIGKLHWSNKEDQTNSSIPETSILGSIKEFFIWMREQSTIKTLFKATFLMVFFNTWVWQVGLLLRLVETKENGEEIYSLLMGLYGLGVIVVNIIIPFVWKKMTIRVYLIGSLIWGLGIVSLGFTFHISLYFVGVLIASIGLPISGLARVYLIQTLVPASKLGRAFSFNAVILYGSNVISLVLFGALSAIIEIHIIFIICGSLMVLSAILYMIRILTSEKTRSKTVKSFE